MKRPVSWYDKHADSIAKRYESVDPESLHRWMADLLPDIPAIVLDVGAGTGRDAAWLASKGYEVYAAEPSAPMRGQAKALHPSAPVRWIADSLPGLENTNRTGVSFDAILLSAVWMHITPKQRQRAFRKLISLLNPGGLIALSVRHGPAKPERGMHPVDEQEIETLARNHGAIVHRAIGTADQLGREGVRWTNYGLRLPDDGTGALPLLRHVILNDSKSSTYKLGLLRSLCRIADGLTGLARRCDDKDSVTIPLGLVALIWIRLYKPLLESNCPQSPANIGDKGLGFVKEPFRRLAFVSNLDLRVGMRLGGQQAQALHGSVLDAAALIERMPARYMTYPDGQPILPVRRSTRIPRPTSVLIDEVYLRGFGEMLVPRAIWRALQRYSVWIEPALVEEWIRLMQGYAHRQGRALERDRAAAAMTWSDPNRDVQLARSQAGQLLRAGRLYCVWSGKSLSSTNLDMDHCFPWSAWPCSDLWNLMPTSRSVNQKEKREKLPGPQLMLASQDRIISWWEAAYRTATPLIQERFVLEATASLPCLQPTDPDLDTLFEGMLSQRSRLRFDQRVPEWDGEKYL